MELVDDLNRGRNATYLSVGEVLVLYQEIKHDPELRKAITYTGWQRIHHQCVAVLRDAEHSGQARLEWAIFVRPLLAYAFDELLTRDFEHVASQDHAHGLGQWWYPAQRYFNPHFLGWMNFIPLRDKLIRQAVELGKKHPVNALTFQPFAVELILRTSWTFDKGHEKADPTMRDALLRYFGLTKAYREYMARRESARRRAEAPGLDGAWIKRPVRPTA